MSKTVRLIISVRLFDNYSKSTEIKKAAFKGVFSLPLLKKRSLDAFFKAHPRFAGCRMFDVGRSISASVVMGAPMSSSSSARFWYSR